MKKTLVILAVLSLAACARDTDGTDTTVADTTGGDVDIGLTTDTVNVPTFGTEKDTVVIDKPVVTGRKPVEVKRPTVDVKKP